MLKLMGTALALSHTHQGVDGEILCRCTNIFCWSKGVAADSFHPVLNQVSNADLIFFINDVFIVPRVFVTFLSTLGQVVMINDFITKWHGFTCTKIGLRSGLREILLKSEQSTNSICSLPSSAQKAFNHTHFPFSFPC